MPDPKEMSGIPRPVPVGDLPNRTVSVRLIRGALSNNIAGHPVDLLIDGTPRTVKTDENGRAEFGPLESWRQAQGGRRRRWRAARVAGVSGAGPTAASA